MKKFGYGVLLSSTLLLTSCGTSVSEETNGQPDIVEDEFKSINLVNGREIIVELEQTVKETPARDLAAKEVIDIDGETSKELAEEMVIQTIEAEAIIEGIKEFYGDLTEFEKHGILFMENKSQGDDQSGIWIGLKNPDEKLNMFVDVLQSKVDAGEILAAPIFIFRSDYTQADLYELQEEILVPLQEMYLGQGAFGVSGNVKTGAIEITHDFLTGEQQTELREKFASHALVFEQEGQLAAQPGESILIYPEELFTTKQQTDGGYVIEANEEEFLVTGGEHDAVRFKYPGNIEQIKVGQRVEVDSTGMILYSYPGQGVAKYIRILPEYKPEKASSSESEVVHRVIVLAKEKFGGVIKIHSVIYDEKASEWLVTVKQDDDKVDFKIED